MNQPNQLAKSKINSIKDLISKAIQDEKISDAEFSLIIKEMDKFNAMKLEIRKKDLKKTNGQEIDETLIKVRKELARLIPSAPPT